ncbi:MAG: relaxase/mobilization nuclease domain-containing protein [Mesorhizobium sp.]
MNWAKGRKTRGRGTSFKGALTYALHDKSATTTERVGFVELRNLATADPDRAWSEMMALVDAADDLKRRSGVKATGRKMTKPVYAFTLNWHEADNPDAAHMRETALDALKALGMENLQAVIVEHTDRPHRHVHVIVNLVDPDTGKSVSLSNDEHKLDRWADDYEVAQGIIRSPDRRAKFAALDQGRDPPKRPGQASSREEWEATRGQNSPQARERAAAIKAEYAARVGQLKTILAERYRMRRAEGDRLWNGHRADSKAIRDRYQPFIDAIYRSRRTAPPHPHTEQALRDLQETAEWKELGRRQFARRKTFNKRERHLLGFITNIISLHHAALKRGDRPSFFLLAVSLSHRRASFEKGLEHEKQALRQSQAQRRKGRADILRAACRHELQQAAAEFRIQRKALSERHAGEIVAEKAEWRNIATERDKAWAEYRREFALPARDQSGTLQASMSQRFNQASTGKEREDSGKVRDGKGEGRAGSGGGQQQAGGWRKRRSADERRADGSYKPRNRPDRGRSRSR